jgi:hypothetical protein
MAIHAINTGDTFEFTSAADQDSDDPTRFKFRPLTSRELAGCGVGFDANGLVMPSDNAIRVVATAFQSVENLIDTDDERISADNKIAARVQKLVNKIPLPVLYEAAMEVVKHSALNEEDPKNLP